MCQILFPLKCHDPVPFWSFDRKTYTWSSRKSSYFWNLVDFMKSGGFHVKSIQNLIKSDVSTKTLQFGVCKEGAMTQDFMKSWFIAPLLHSSNWIVLVETFSFYKVLGGFHMKSAGFHEIERPLARNCNPMFFFWWSIQAFSDQTQAANKWNGKEIAAL